MQQQPARRILLRSPRIAQRAFGLDSPGQIVRSVPRAKFMFKAQFNPSAAARDMLLGADLNNINDIRNVSFKVKSIDKPKVNLTTVELNQYNKKKLAYTKVDYNDASLRIYDTVDNSMLALWINYFTYYFGDSRGGKTPDLETFYRQSSVGAIYQDGTGWGFRPINENVYFFNSIDVLAFYGQTKTTFKYINPRIVSIDWQGKDYASNDLEEITVNFKYEGIVYERFGQPTSLEETGWRSNDTIDYPYGYITTPVSFQPRIFNGQTTAYNRPQQTTGNLTNPSNVIGGMPVNTSAIAPGARIPNTLLNSQLLQPNNLVSGLAMALNYIPNGIQGINNIPFATIASLAGIQGIGGASRLLGDAVARQVSGLTNSISSGISSLFGTNQIQNVYTGGIPQPPDYMSGTTASQVPDVTTNGDYGSSSSVDPNAVMDRPTTPGVSRQGEYGDYTSPSAESTTFVGEEPPSVIQGQQSEFVGEEPQSVIQGQQSEFVGEENAAVEVPNTGSVNEAPAEPSSEDYGYF